MWGVIAGVVISAVSAYAQNRANARQNDAQYAVNRQNAQGAYDIAMGNVAAQMAIGRFNALAALQAGRISSQAIMQESLVNARIIRATTDYNDDLLEAEEEQIWDAYGLDTKIIKDQRAVERGQIEAYQSASGTVMGQDSNADVITDQMLQEKMDQFVIRHNADIKAADIFNARAQGKWEGEMQIKKTLWEGQLQATVAQANAGLQAASALAGSTLSGMAGTMSAQIGLSSGMSSADIISSQNSIQNRAQLTQGLFGAAANGVTNYYANRPVTPTAPGRVYIDGRSGFDSMSNAGASLAASN